MKIKKYIKKPIPVEMVLVDSDNALDIAEWCGGVVWNYEADSGCYISLPTREGTLRAYVGDFIAKGIEGEFYPIGKEIHEKTYISEEEFLKLNAPVMVLGEEK